MHLRNRKAPGQLRPARRRISRWRRRLGLFALAVLVSGTWAWFHFTDEDRLRAYAEEWLSDYSGGEARIEHVYFDPLSGLELTGVTLSLPESAEFGFTAPASTERTIFHVGQVYLRLRLLAYFTGGQVVPEVTATDSELTLVHRLSDDARNWQVLERQRTAKRRKPAAAPKQLPIIHVRNLRVVQQELDAQGRSTISTQTLWGEAVPDASRPATYDVRFRRLAEPDASGHIPSDSGRLMLNTRTWAVSGDLPALSVDDLAVAIPAALLSKLDMLALSGQIQARDVNYNPNGLREGTFTIRDGRLSVPVEELEEPLAAEQRFIQLSQVAATIRVRNETATAEAEGMFRDSRFAVRATATLGSGGVAEMGFDADVDLFNVLLPVNDPDTPPPERRFAQRWFKLREFVADYDPRGRADFKLHFRKLPGKDQGVRFVDGTLIARGASARYFRFPYRLYDLSGSIYFRPDGRIELREFTGVHGQGRAVITGLVEGYRSQGLDVRIQAERIAMDGDLTRCLSERDQRLIDLFDAQASMNLDVKLHRDPKPHGLTLQQNPWKAAVDVDFLDGTVKYAALPYPLEGLTGRMRIDRGGFEFHRLRAGRGSARVELSGRASRAEDGRRELDLQLEAHDVPADDVLREALVGEARDMYQRIDPSGHMEIAARIRNAADSADTSYDLNVTLNAGELNLPETQARLSQVSGRLQLTPERMTIVGLDGRFGTSPVSLSGWVNTGPSADGLAVRITSNHLLLNEHLRRALPQGLQPMWQSVNPGGPIRLDLTYARGVGIGAATRPASAPATQSVDSDVSYTAIIDAQDCTAQLAEFPLPLEHVHGRFVLTPGQVALEQVTASNPDVQFELAGRLQLGAEGVAGDLALELRNLTFSEPLRQSLPGKLRRLWYDAKPSGKANISIQRLTFARGPDREHWSAEGSAELDHLALRIGTDLTELTGRVSGRGGVGTSIFADVDLALREGRVEGRLLTEAQAHLARPAGDAHLRLTGLQGQFYGGSVMGQMEVNYAPSRPTFGLSLTAREVSLEQFLNDGRKPGTPPVTTKGTVEGTLGLSGRFGDALSRRGSGTVFIRQAHMAKIPLVLSIFSLASANFDDNAFEDVRFAYDVGGEDLLLREIDLRGKVLSMVGAGRVHVPTRRMDLTLLVGSPLRLPRMEVLTDLVEGMARELLEVHVAGPLDQPEIRADVVKSVTKAIEAVFNARRSPEN